MGRSGRVGLFLQARIGSERLPGKALLPLDSRSAVGCAMERLKRVNADIHVLLTDAASYPQLEEEAVKYSFEIMAGPAEDVLKRYAAAARRYDVGTVIRATGDNPLVFANQAELILSRHLEARAGHSWFTGMPLGAGVEVFEATALFTAEEKTNMRYDREHVTPFIYNNSELFRLNHIQAGPEAYYPEGRITLDTLNDYSYIKQIFSSLSPEELFEPEKIISWLKKNQHPDVQL